MMNKKTVRNSLAGMFLLAALGFFLPGTRFLAMDDQPSSAIPPSGESADTLGGNPSPVDLALSPDESWLVTANRGTNSVSLIDVTTGQVIHTASCGKRPATIVVAANSVAADAHAAKGNHGAVENVVGNDGLILVPCTHSSELCLFRVENRQLQPAGTIPLLGEPFGVAVTKDGQTAYVSLASLSQVAEIDLPKRTVRRLIDVGRWPKYLALSADESRLAVGCSGDEGVAVVDCAAGKMEFLQKFSGINIGHLHPSADGKYVYFPWMIYRNNPISRRTIEEGWVLASRIARIHLDAPAPREAISLDPRGKAVADPLGLALTSNEETVVCTSSGTGELLIYNQADLVYQDVGGPGDHIDPKLLNHPERFNRILIGGRPMGLRISRDNRRVFIANYLTNEVQVVDLEQQELTQSISLGGEESPSLVRQGEAIFYDARRSLNQWYSCHSCHTDGDTNSMAMDTTNDGTERTFKTVLSLRNIKETGPWTWHGWQTDLNAAMFKSLTETMLGPQPAEEDATALLAFLETLEAPPNPHQVGDQSQAEEVERGRLVFNGEAAGCAHCHSGPHYTDGEIHDVGLGSMRDAYVGYNTPSLLGVYNRVRLLHDGRAKSLEQLLTGPHDPAKVTGKRGLSESERHDLIEFLKTL